jgi:predicted phage terminase large subunit-like protein
VEPKEGNCITVEGDGMYLAGRTMLPTHNTTLAEFFLAWKVGRSPFLPNLIGSHNNAFLAGMYGEMLRIMDSRGEYRWSDVFPGLRVIATNAKDLMIGIGYDKKDDMRFKSLEFTSIGAGNAGKVRAMGILYCDDLISDLEQSLSIERLDKLWQQYTTDLRQRKVGNQCKELHIATRWSVHDVLGRLEQEYEGDPRARFIKFPALDENGESNFDYPYGLGYTTEMLRKQESIMDDISWRCLYLNEPIEREGTLFSPDELQYFIDLPDKEPDAVIAVCDTKEQGSDYCAMPVLYQYGEMFYVNSFLCDNSKVEIVQDRVAQRLVDEKVKLCQIESNRGGTLFANSVRDKVKELGGFTSITTKWTQTNKNTRIVVNSSWAKSHFLFRDPASETTTKEYRTAMNQLCTYSMVGKSKHDDAPDSISLAVDYILSRMGNKAQILKRPF